MNRQILLNTMNNKMLLILEILAASNTELYGLEIIERSDGKLHRGTIYLYLSRLHEMGLVSVRPEDYVQPEIGLPRSLYSITDDGRRKLRDSRESGAFLLPQPA